MGKRKSDVKPPPKKRMDKLDKAFSCPFCNHGSSVECRIDMKNQIGEANCRICQESFSTTINAMRRCHEKMQIVSSKPNAYNSRSRAAMVGVASCGEEEDEKKLVVLNQSL
ncbi:transcription elongation factor 1 [Hordeum vulgare]|nr:transcription elongation factor 1 [Hordeum vulgare]